MLEVRSYEGSAEELSEFVIAQWTASYRDKIAVPLWSADYFRWQLRMDEPEQRRHLIAAYDGGKLAGVVPFCPMPFRLDDDLFAASQASWLSVAPEFQGQGVAGKLIQGSRAVHRELGLKFQLGFAYYGRQASRAPAFWLRSQSSSTLSIRKAGFWVRVLDAPRAADWNSDYFEGLFTRATAPIFGSPQRRLLSNLVIRPAEERDVSRCLEIAELATRHCRLRLAWDRDSLSRQLGLRGFNHALVARRRWRIARLHHVLSPAAAGRDSGDVRIPGPRVRLRTFQPCPESAARFSPFENQTIGSRVCIEAARGRLPARPVYQVWLDLSTFGFSRACDMGERATVPAVTGTDPRSLALTYAFEED
jgi:GNAT superfamily N-acetyltransferase